MWTQICKQEKTYYHVPAVYQKIFNFAFLCFYPISKHLNGPVFIRICFERK